MNRISVWWKQLWCDHDRIILVSRNNGYMVRQCSKCGRLTRGRYSFNFTGTLAGYSSAPSLTYSIDGATPVKDGIVKVDPRDIKSPT